VVIAIAAIFLGFVYLTIVIVFFGIFNPEPYFTLWGVVSRRSRGPRLAGSAPAKGSWAGGRRSEGSDPGSQKNGGDRKGGDGRGHDRQPIAMVRLIRAGPSARLWPRRFRGT
jgi:hypothetical protein